MCRVLQLQLREITTKCQALSLLRMIIHILFNNLIEIQSLHHHIGSDPASRCCLCLVCSSHVK